MGHKQVSQSGWNGGEVGGFSYVFAGTKPEQPCAAQRVLHRLPASVWCALPAELGLYPSLPLLLCRPLRS